MQTVIKMGGFTTGGLNFDCKVRRESTDLLDMFIAHIGSMDTYAKGLKNAAYIMKSGRMAKMMESRYNGWSTFDFASNVDKGISSFEALEAVAIKNGEPKQVSGKQELFENVFNEELFLASKTYQ
jgi:xylose isomerase